MCFLLNLQSIAPIVRVEVSCPFQYLAKYDPFNAAVRVANGEASDHRQVAAVQASEIPRKKDFCNIFCGKEYHPHFS